MDKLWINCTEDIKIDMYRLLLLCLEANKKADFIAGKFDIGVSEMYKQCHV